MSIDTAAKRRSVSGILTALTIVGVTMDATPDSAWRQSAGWGYQGIAAGAPAAAIDHCDDHPHLSCRTPTFPHLSCRTPTFPHLSTRC